MNQNGVLPDEKTYNVIMDAYGNKGRLQDMLAMFGEMKVRGLTPTVSSYNTLMNYYKNHTPHETTKLVRLFEEIERLGLVPDVRTYTILITAFGQKGDLRSMNEFFLKMKKAGIAPTLPTYVAIMDAYGALGQFDKMQQLFVLVQQEGIPLHIKLFNSMMASYALHTRLSKIKETFELLKEHQLSPNVATFNALFKAFGAKGRVQLMMEYFEKMNQYGRLQPDEDSFTYLLEALARKPSAIHHLEQIIMVLKSTTAVKPTTAIYNAILEGYRKAGAATSLHVNDSPTTNSVNSSPIVHGGEGDGDGSSTGAQHNRGRYFEQVIRCFNEMKQKRIRVNQRTYEQVIAACGDHQRPDSIFPYYREMTQQYGIQPRDDIFIVMLHAFSNTNCLDKMIQVLYLITRNHGDTTSNSSGNSKISNPAAPQLTYKVCSTFLNLIAAKEEALKQQHHKKNKQKKQQQTKDSESSTSTLTLGVASSDGRDSVPSLIPVVCRELFFSLKEKFATEAAAATEAKKKSQSHSQTHVKEHVTAHDSVRFKSLLDEMASYQKLLEYMPSPATIRGDSQIS
jgi:pentatricopeptide repeat protein